MSAMAAWHKSFSSTGPKRQCPEGRSCADPCIPANQGPCQDLLPKRTVPWKLTGHPPLSLFWFPPPRRLPGPAVESFWMVRSRGRGGGGPGCCFQARKCFPCTVGQPSRQLPPLGCLPASSGSCSQEGLLSRSLPHSYHQGSSLNFGISWISPQHLIFSPLLVFPFVFLSLLYSSFLNF